MGHIKKLFMDLPPAGITKFSVVHGIFFHLFFYVQSFPPPEVVFMIKKYVTKHTIQSLYLTLELKIIIVPSVKRLSETNAQDIFPIK